MFEALKERFANLMRLPAWLDWRRARAEPKSPLPSIAARGDDVPDVDNGKHATDNIWTLKQGLLDRLGLYLKAAARLKRLAPDEYALYSRVGAALGPRDTCFRSTPDPSVPLVSFAAVALLDDGGDDWDDEMLCPQITTIMRMKRAPGVQPHNGVLYKVCVMHATAPRAAKKFSHAAEYYIDVDPITKEVTPLKQYYDTSQLVRPKSRYMGRKEKPFRLPRAEWQHASILRVMRDDHPDQSVQELASTMFHFTLQQYVWSQAGLMVHAQKDSVAAVFGVDMLRTPQMFADRDLQVTENGKRKKVFHIVRTHKRTLADGTEQHVRSHFRGSRKFMWNGFSVVISMPGTHHHFHAHSDTPALEAEEYGPDEMVPGDMANTVILGRRIRSMLRN